MKKPARVEKAAAAPQVSWQVKDIMTEKVITLSPDDDLALANNVVDLAHVRHLPVVDRNRVLIGLITHRDLLGIWADCGDRGARSLLAQDVMTTRVQVIRATAPLNSAMKMMLANKFGCLPVVDHRRHLVGIITEYDVVKFAKRLVADLDRALSQLNRFQKAA